MTRCRMCVKRTTWAAWPVTLSRPDEWALAPDPQVESTHVLFTAACQPTHWTQVLAKAPLRPDDVAWIIARMDEAMADAEAGRHDLG